MHGAWGTPPAWLKYATDPNAGQPIPTAVDASGNPTAWRPAVYRGFADVTYTVKVGDTLTQIVLDQGLCAAANGDWSQCIAVANMVAAANGIDNPDLIQPGQQLVLGTAAVSATPDGAPVVGPVRPPVNKPLGWGLAGLAAGLAIWVVFGKWR